MPTPTTITCWSCEQDIEIEGKISRLDNCPHCDVALKCCYNCRFYDREAHHQCVEPQAEWVRYKEKANFCSYFHPRGKGEPVIQRIEPPVSKEKSAARKARQLQNSPAGKRHNIRLSDKDKKKAAWDALFKD
ncbi:MAG: hypothetical protein ABIJ61_05765 [bacterium]